jgi:hypothetical protein
VVNFFIDIHNKTRLFFPYDDLMEISPKTRLMMVTDQIDVSPMAPSVEKSPGTRGPNG